MRDRRGSGLRPLGQLLPGAMIQNGGNRALFFPLSEGSGTSIYDLGGRAPSGVPLAGVATNAWAAQHLGIQIETQATAANMVTAALQPSVTGLDMTFVKSIFDCAGGFNDILYFGAQLSIQASPAADTNNYLLSCGRQDAVNPDTTGQLCLRINANRRVAWHLKTREATSANQFGVKNTALTVGVPATVFSMILPGTSGNVPWYHDGALDSTASLAGLHEDKGPIAHDDGIMIFGRTQNGSASPGNRLGTAGAASAATSPTVANLLLGRCPFSAANQSLLQRLASYLHERKRLPAWFAEIG